MAVFDRARGGVGQSGSAPYTRPSPDLAQRGGALELRAGLGQHAATARHGGALRPRSLPLRQLLRMVDLCGVEGVLTARRAGGGSLAAVVWQSTWSNVAPRHLQEFRQAVVGGRRAQRVLADAARSLHDVDNLRE